MKALLLTLIISFSTLAKVNDFNALIANDTSAQKELHSKLKNQVYSRKEIAARDNMDRTKREKIDKQDVVFLDAESSQIVSPSSDKYFRFKKESKQKATNPRKNQHRVAKELRELGI